MRIAFWGMNKKRKNGILCFIENVSQRYAIFYTQKQKHKNGWLTWETDY